MLHVKGFTPRSNKTYGNQLQTRQSSRIIPHRRTHILVPQQSKRFNTKIATENVSKRNISTSRSLFQTGAQGKAVPLTKLATENFLAGESSVYVEEMFEAWKKDPSSVHTSWAAFFSNIEKGMPVGQAFQPPPSLRQPFQGGLQSQVAGLGQDVEKMVADSMRLLLLIRAYQVRGHVLANLDPLGLTKHAVPPELQIGHYGFTEQDLDREFYIGDIGNNLISGFLNQKPKATLREIISRLQEVYCSTIGFEYMHIQDREQCNWIRERIETPVQYKFSAEDKIVLLDRLTWATSFESFLNVKFTSAKRFGVDGCEALIPGLKALLDRACDLGVEHMVMGMPHRGRLNVLANVLRKPLESIFHEFETSKTGASSKVMKQENSEGLYLGSGDVKYHLGTSRDRTTRSGKKIHISLLANPSHLEAVDPVAEGKARARQYFLKDDERNKVCSVLLHGDAAFAAQGVIYETLDLSGLPNYTTGGTIHIIVNNQIGFTTDPISSRASIYCTDVAKSVGCPIFHVNGDDPEAVVHACRLAAEWRQTFHKNVVVDIVCYRKYGHNESDEPRYTQPLMYKQIDKQIPVLKKYISKLKEEKVVNDEQVTQIQSAVQSTLAKAFSNAATYTPGKTEWFDSPWKGFKKSEQALRIRSTGVPMETLQNVGKAMHTVPEGFTLHPQLKKQLAGIKQMMETGEKFNWAAAEALAFGTLLLEGNHVRLSGQDVERGTFSHRHAVLHDQQTNAVYTPLNHIGSEQEVIHVTNSSLSEYAVLGFELGYSQESPNQLVLWEAQFGDFANGAQVIFDQFISAGEAKWGRQSGLVMLLPHGYDGQGPEHSSCRLERWLQLTDSDPDRLPAEQDPEKVIALTNMQVINCSTPANYYHALRRQVHRPFRKPLIVASPKNLLRHRMAVSNLKDMTEGSGFVRLYPETSNDLVPDNKIKRVIFCSGKVYYELVEEREKRSIRDIAILRVEQLNPFPFDLVIEQLKKYNNKAEIVWCQEEPKNMGAWTWIAPHFRTAAKDLRGHTFYPTYVGRAASASPATGLGTEHTAQWMRLMNEALGPAETTETQ